MFSFHKPKVYRSSTGCCICKAKSSSSRFTDSKKYEEDFLECFQLSSRRQGEICNACVLLVKRWKKLPDGPKRNWRHVVDARAGPGMKSMTKFKSKQKKQLMLMEHLGTENNKGRHHDANSRRDRGDFEREFSPTPSDKSDDMDIDYTTGGESPSNIRSAVGNDMIESIGVQGESGDSSPRLSVSHSPGGSDCEDTAAAAAAAATAILVFGSRRRKASKAVLSHRQRRRQDAIVAGFIDSDYWTKESICCGVVFRGRNGEVLVDVSRGCRVKPCSTLQQRCKRTVLAAAAAAVTIALESAAAVVVQSNSNGDNSSDSGYDDTTINTTINTTSIALGNTDQPTTTTTDTSVQCSSVRRKTAAEVW